MSDRIEEIKARLDAATPGPWPDDYVYDTIRHIARNCEFESVTDPDFGWDRYSDSPLIAHAPDDIAYLLTELERLSAPRECPSDLDHDGMLLFLYAHFAGTEFDGSELFCPRCGQPLSSPQGET